MGNRVFGGGVAVAGELECMGVSRFRARVEGLGRAKRWGYNSRLVKRYFTMRVNPFFL